MKCLAIHTSLLQAALRYGTLIFLVSHTLLYNISPEGHDCPSMLLVVLNDVYLK